MPNLLISFLGSLNSIACITRLVWLSLVDFREAEYFFNPSKKHSQKWGRSLGGVTKALAFSSFLLLALFWFKSSSFVCSSKDNLKIYKNVRTKSTIKITVLSILTIPVKREVGSEDKQHFSIKMDKTMFSCPANSIWLLSTVGNIIRNSLFYQKNLPTAISPLNHYIFEIFNWSMFEIVDFLIWAKLFILWLNALKVRVSLKIRNFKISKAFRRFHIFKENKEKEFHVETSEMSKQKEVISILCPFSFEINLLAFFKIELWQKLYCQT